MPLMHCVHWYSEKRNVFSHRPKTAAVCDRSRKFLGSEFQNIGLATDICCKPVRRYHQLMAGSKTKMTSRGSCRDWNATRS